MKSKYKIDTDMIKIENDYVSNNEVLKTAKTNMKSKITIEVDSDFKAEIKSWCAKNKITLNEALTKGFSLLQKQ